MQGIVPEMLVVDGVVLQRPDQVQQVVGLGDEDPGFVQDVQNPGYDLVDFGHVREDVGCGHKAGGAVFAVQPSGAVSSEKKSLEAVDTPFVCKPGPVRGVDAQNPAAPVLEVGQQRAVVGADVDDKRGAVEAQPVPAPFEQVREILPENACGTARVGIPRRKQDFRVHLAADLHQVRVRAVEKLQGGTWAVRREVRPPVACRSPAAQKPRNRTDCRFVDWLIWQRVIVSGSCGRHACASCSMSRVR